MCLIFLSSVPLLSHYLSSPLIDIPVISHPPPQLTTYCSRQFSSAPPPRLFSMSVWHACTLGPLCTEESLHIYQICNNEGSCCDVSGCSFGCRRMTSLSAMQRSYHVYVQNGWKIIKMHTLFQSYLVLEAEYLPCRSSYITVFKHLWCYSVSRPRIRSLFFYLSSIKDKT